MYILSTFPQYKKAFVDCPFCVGPINEKVCMKYDEVSKLLKDVIKFDACYLSHVFVHIFILMS